MRAWPSVLGAALLTVLVLAATLIGSRTESSCPPPSARSVEALFAPCLTAHDSERIAWTDGVAPAKIAGRSFEERWRMAAGPLSE